MEMHLVELAVAERLFVLVAVPLLLWIGYRLFELGVTGKMTITGTLKNGWGVKATQVAPGSLCFILGVVLGIYILDTTGFHFQVLNGDTTGSVVASNEPGHGAPASGQPSSPGTAELSKPVVGQPKPPAASTTLSISGLAGMTSQLLSTRIRYALSEDLICTRAKANLPGQNANACEDTYFSHFTHIPSQADIDRIEQEERAAAANDPKAIRALQDEANAVEVH